MNRRRFLYRGAAISAGLPLIFTKGCKSIERNFRFEKYHGAMLYTVRDIIGNDPDTVIKRIAEMGYRTVELHHPGELEYQNIFEEYGLKVISTHIPHAHLHGDWREHKKVPDEDRDFQKLADELVKAGLEYLVIPFMPLHFREEKYWKIHAQKLNILGNMAKKSGIQLAYHNHAFEFAPLGISNAMDILTKFTDPDLLKLELDVFWISVSGNDPLDVLDQYKNRVDLLHLKDLAPGTGQSFDDVSYLAFEELGDGSLDFKAILSKAEENGISYAFVEQDKNMTAPLKSLKKSIKYLQSY